MRFERCKDGLKRFSIALSSLAVATWVRFLLVPYVGTRVPFSTYMLAVLFTAWLAGPIPGIICLVLGVVAAAHFFVPPAGSLMVTDPGDLLALLTYAVVSAVAISLFYVTERQHAVTRRQLDEIETLSEKLRSADRRKDQFLAQLAHELRNPLAPISAALATLERQRPKSRPAAARSLQTMKRQLSLLVSIVNDLLDVSRFVHHRVKLNCELLDMRRLVELAVEQNEPELQHRGHDLQVVLPQRPVMIMADRIRVVQIVSNLLSNAAKYTPRDGRIQVLLDALPEHARLEVTDNGIGIAPEALESVFELFARGSMATLRDLGGLGMGLPIAREFAEMHNGSLILQSDGIGQGCRCVLNLPRTADAAEPECGTSAGESPGSVAVDMPAEPRQTAMRILLIDDNSDAADALSEFLALEGFATRTAYDGLQGLRAVTEFRPDCVLLDIGLPGMDGFEVARRLRKIDDIRPPHIIAVTGWGDDAFVEKTRRAGFDGHFVKPVDPDRLVQRLLTMSSSDNATVTA